MSRRVTSKSKPAKLRKWGIVLMRNRGEFLGYLEAADAKAAEKAAVAAFQLDEDKRKRLLVRPCL